MSRSAFESDLNLVYHAKSLGKKCLIYLNLLETFYSVKIFAYQ